MSQLVQIIVPVSICVVLPALLVWIVFRSRNNKVNKNAEVVIKAIENNSSIDADKLISALATPEKSPAEVLRLRLLRGCMFSLIGLAFFVMMFFSLGFDESLLALISGGLLAVGISYLIVYFVTRKEIEGGNK